MMTHGAYVDGIQKYIPCGWIEKLPGPVVIEDDFNSLVPAKKGGGFGHEA